MSVETRKRSNKAARTSSKATKMSNVATIMIDEAMNMSEEAAKMSGGAASRFLVAASHSPRGFATRLIVASPLQNRQLRRLRYTNHHDNLHMIECKNVIVIIV